MTLGAALEAGWPTEAALARLGTRAMATGWELLLPSGFQAAVPAGQDAFALLGRMESQLTVYHAASEVSRINRAAPARAVRVEQRLFDLLQRAERLHHDTDGAFDPTLGKLLRAWGFFRGPRRVPPPEEIAATPWGWRHVHLDAPTRSVRYTAPVEVNLGSIGKGYALDRLAERLSSRWGVTTMLLQGGGSSVLGRGCPHGLGQGWLVDVQHPWAQERKLCRVRLLNRAMGTSAATHQHFEHQGRKLGHILDPRSGWPAFGVASATALAPTATEADALATAFFVAGPSLAERLCTTNHELGAVLLPDGAARPLVFGNVSVE